MSAVTCTPCARGAHMSCTWQGCQCPCTQRAALWADRAAAARLSAWGLLLASAVALGACLAALHAGDVLWAGFAAVGVALGWAAGSERAEMRACREHVAALDGAWMDEWLGAWA